MNQSTTILFPVLRKRVFVHMLKITGIWLAGVLLAALPSIFYVDNNVINMTLVSAALFGSIICLLQIMKCGRLQKNKELFMPLKAITKEQAETVEFWCESFPEIQKFKVKCLYVNSVVSIDDYKLMTKYLITYLRLNP